MERQGNARRYMQSMGVQRCRVRTVECVGVRRAVSLSRGWCLKNETT